MPFQFHAVPLRAPSCEGFMSPIRSFQFQFFRFHVQAGRNLKRSLGLFPAAVCPILGFSIHGNSFIPIVAKSIHADTFRYRIRSVSFYAVSIFRFSCALAPVFATVKKLVQSLMFVFQLMSQWLDDYITPGLRNSYQTKNASDSSCKENIAPAFEHKHEPIFLDRCDRIWTLRPQDNSNGWLKWADRLSHRLCQGRGAHLSLRRIVRQYVIALEHGLQRRTNFATCDVSLQASPP